MNVVEESSERYRPQRISNRPVIIADWAEAVVDLRRARSVRRHPSNRAPEWAKDCRIHPEATPIHSAGADARPVP